MQKGKRRERGSCEVLLTRLAPLRPPPLIWSLFSTCYLKNYLIHTTSPELYLHFKLQHLYIWIVCTISCYVMMLTPSECYVRENGGSVQMLHFLCLKCSFAGDTILVISKLNGLMRYFVSLCLFKSMDSFQWIKVNIHFRFRKCKSFVMVLFYLSAALPLHQGDELIIDITCT